MKTRDNPTWLTELRSPGRLQDAALEDLRTIIQRGLNGALTRYLRPDDPHFEGLVEEATQETLLKVLDKLDSFEGRSQFTTWVYRIAVRSALTELRRKRWQNVSLDEMLENYQNENLFSSTEPHTEIRLDQAELFNRVQDVIDHDLTSKQRKALAAIATGMSMDKVAEELGTNRNALYKLMHDARTRLKKRLSKEGFEAEEILASFEG